MSNKNHGQDQAKVLTSDEMNYLIYRYLQECGFHHSAFTFAHESHMASVNITPNLVPPAALVTFVQKGLQYMEAEANLDPETGEIVKDLSVLSVEDLITKDIDELRQQVLENREKTQQQIRDILAKAQPQQERNQQQTQQAKAKRAGAKWERAPAQQQKAAAAAAAAAAADEEQPQQQQPQQQGRNRQQQRQKQQQQQAAPLKQEQDEQPPQQQRAQPKGQRQQQQQKAAADGAAAAAAAGDGPVPMDEDAPAAAAAAAAASGEGLEVVSVEEVDGAGDAFICQWSPSDLLVLTGSSGDPQARIYDFNDGAAHSQPRILPIPEEQRAENKDVTAADWHPSGRKLAAASYKGLIRVWRKDGTLEHVVNEHTGPVFVLKWNKRGDMVITGSLQGAKVLEATNWSVAQDLTQLANATLDADWRDDTVFAVCCADGSITVCKVGSQAPLKTWNAAPQGAEMTVVRWSPSGDLLGSVDDEFTVKLWRMSQDAPVAVFNFTREQEVFNMRWSPTAAAAAAAPDGHGQLVATASLDNAVHILDAQSGRELKRLETDDGDAPYCLSFSPDGKFLAVGCNEGAVRLYSMATGKELFKHQSEVSVFDIVWSRNADKVAYTTGGKKVGVLHIKRT